MSFVVEEKKKFATTIPAFSLYTQNTNKHTGRKDEKRYVL